MAIITEEVVPLILEKSSNERAKTTGYEIATPSPYIIIEVLLYDAISRSKDTGSILMLPVIVQPMTSTVIILHYSKALFCGDQKRLIEVHT